jgi:hypothetical protein
VAASVDVAELEDVVAELGQPSAATGERVVLRGRALSAAQVQVVLGHPGLHSPLEVAPDLATDRSVRFVLPGTMPAGLGSVWLKLSAAAGEEIVQSNRLPLPVAPTITSALPMTVAMAGTSATVNLTCAPSFVADQEVAIVVGSRVVPAEDVTPGSTAATFVVTNAVADTFHLRLRVNGVDSRLISDRTLPIPAYDQDQTLTVTP